MLAVRRGVRRWVGGASDGFSMPGGQGLDGPSAAGGLAPVRLGCLLMTLMVLPGPALPAAVGFHGDPAMLVALLSLERLLAPGPMTAAKRLPPGHVLEPMALLLTLAALAEATGCWTLDHLLDGLLPDLWHLSPAVPVLLGVTLSLVLLANESASLAVGHAVDRALIVKTDGLRLFVLAVLPVDIFFPVHIGSCASGLAALTVGVLSTAACLGAIDPLLAPRRDRARPVLLTSACACSLAALLLILRRL